jgi:hypothetical protein
MLKKFPLKLLNSLPGCSGCMGSGIVMMKQYPACKLAWTFSANWIPKLQQNFTVRCRIYIFTALLKMCQQYSLRIPKHVKHNLPSWWHNLKLFVLKWTGMIPLHWSRIWFGLLVMHPWFFSVTILLSISSPSSAYRKRCCKDRPIRFIFSSVLQFCGHLPCANFPKLHTVMHYAVC